MDLQISPGLFCHSYTILISQGINLSAWSSSTHFCRVFPLWHQHHPERKRLQIYIKQDNCKCSCHWAFTMLEEAWEDLPRLLSFQEVPCPLIQFKPWRVTKLASPSRPQQHGKGSSASRVPSSHHNALRVSTAMANLDPREWTDDQTPKQLPTDEASASTSQGSASVFNRVWQQCSAPQICHLNHHSPNHPPKPPSSWW